MPPPAGSAPKRVQAPQPSDRPLPPKRLVPKKVAAERGELDLEGEAVNDEIEQVEIEQNIAVGQQQGPVMSAKRGGGPNAPKPPFSQTPRSGGSRTRTTGPPPAAEPSRGGPEGAPDEGGGEHAAASGAGAGAGAEGKVLQLPRVSQPAQPPPSVEISAQPKDTPVPEGKSEKPEKPEKPVKPVKQSSTVDARRRHQATTRKQALDREIEELKANIEKRKKEIADLENELQPLEEQRKQIPNALKNDRRYNKLPRPEHNDPKLQENLEARLEALNELKEELAANGELSPDIADFIDWEARTLHIRHEIEATRDANAVDEAQLCKY